MGPVNPTAQKLHLMLCWEPTAFGGGGADTTHLEHKRPSQLTGPEETTLSATEEQTRRQETRLKQPRTCGSASDFGQMI